MSHTDDSKAFMEPTDTSLRPSGPSNRQDEIVLQPSAINLEWFKCWFKTSIANNMKMSRIGDGIIAYYEENFKFESLMLLDAAKPMSYRIPQWNIIEEKHMSLFKVLGTRVVSMYPYEVDMGVGLIIMHALHRSYRTAATSSYLHVIWI
jgi:hypothetical protein